MSRIFKYIFLFLTINLCAQVPDKPNPPKLYNNFSKAFPNFVSASEAQQLETDLENFSKETSNQIAVVVVDDFNGYDAASYATEIGNKWGVGQSDFKNGIVILVKPTGGEGQRDLFIAVGYGLEGAIPDLFTKRIRENEIVPYFKQGDYFNGLRAGIFALKKAAKGEYHVKTKSDNDNWIKRHPILFIIIILIIILLLMKNSGGSGRTYYGGGFINFGGGLSWGGGGSSGGFGGFGGGSFGGGGSGGSW